MDRPDVNLMVANLLPPGVRVVWTVAMVALVALFVWRAVMSTGDRRIWHGVYALVAASMGVMFALNPMVAWSSAGVTVLVVAGAGALALAGWMVANRDVGGFELPWFLALADLTIVAYIQVPSPGRPILLCSAMAAYLAVLVIARAVGAVKARRGPIEADGGVWRRVVAAADGPDAEEPAPQRGGGQKGGRNGGRNGGGGGRQGGTRATKAKPSSTRTAVPARDASATRVAVAVPAALSLLTLAVFYMINI